MTQAVPAWDLFLRLFHWTLATLMAASVTTGLLGGNLMKWHMWSGYTILGLLAFRLAWGFVGSPTARFSAFLRGPAAVRAHVRDLLGRRPSFHLGHNPLGGWMVVLMLLAVLFQAATGLFANDDIATEGPLYAYISKELSDRLTGLHKLNVKVLYGLVGLHVAAIAFYHFARGENLVGPMVHGRKTPPTQDKMPFNKDVFVANATRLESVWAMDASRFFTPGTDKPVSGSKVAGFTDVKAEVWNNPQKFKEAFDDNTAAIGKLAAAARSGDEAAMKAAAGGVGKACKGCHDDFRVQ